MAQRSEPRVLPASGKVVVVTVLMGVVAGLVVMIMAILAAWHKERISHRHAAPFASSHPRESEEHLEGDAGLIELEFEQR
ncbi:MAG TPA: hypothetical protein VGJ84_01505 [Polyangiaceae bacterium]|jgi:hypothetical protein